MKATWESLYRNEAVKQGHSEEFIKESVSYARNLLGQNFPVIFDEKHFSILINGDVKDIISYVYYLKQEYKEFFIKKRNGGKRHISVPPIDLKRMQSWILKNILEKDVNALESVHSFIKKDETGSRGIFTNAQVHSCCEWMVKVDILHFYDNIHIYQVKEYFISLGYTEEVANLLAEICTFKNRLPQGAPTSPALSNLICRKMDADFRALCENHGWSYSRYADDMTFSGRDKNDIIKLKTIENIVINNRLRLKYAKTRIAHKGMRMKITGLTVGNGVHVPKQYRREVWTELHFCYKYGVESHLKRKGVEKKNYKFWLLGRIMYIRSIDRTCGDNMLQRFNEINWIL